MSHTKGPWEVAEYGPYDKLLIRQAGGDLCMRPEVCHVLDTDCHWGRSNAALIAAAPELLEACERLVKIMEMLNEHDMPSCKFAKEAIKKARGDNDN